MKPLHRSARRLWPIALFVLAVVLAETQVARPQSSGGKRPLTHADYDNWRSIQGPQLSRDGKFLSYTLGPVVGDRELVIRNLVTDKEWRFGAGSAGPAPGAGETPPEPMTPSLAPPVGPGPAALGAFGVGAVTFSADSKVALFLVPPGRAATEQAKKDKKKPEEMPKSKLALFTLDTGAVSWIEEVKAFRMAEESGRWLAYQKGTARPEAAAGAEGSEAPAPKLGKKGAGGAGKKGGGLVAPAVPTPAVGAPLTLRDLTTQSERTFDDVSDYQFTKDGKLLVLVIATKKDDTSGVYVVGTESAAAPQPILAGKGRYTRPVWDEKQTQLAFLTTRDDTSTSRPKYSVYSWQRNEMALAGAAGKQVADVEKSGPAPAAPPPPAKDGADAAPQAPPSGKAPAPAKETSDTPSRAGQLIAADYAGFKEGWSISERGGLSFSGDGSRLFLATGPAPKETPKDSAKEAAKQPVDAIANRAVFELWHWKDEFIQPMQKVRGNRDNVTYRAVLHLKDKRFTQLADENLATMTLSKDGAWAAASDDKPYRTLVGFDANYSDHYLVSTTDGARKRVLTKHEGGVSWSQGGKYLLYFNDKHWHCLSAADGKLTNLTKDLPVKFWNEDTDTPSTPPSFGQAGWTPDDQHVLLYDQYDIWQVAADGTGAKNLTGGAGRKTKTQFRAVRFGDSSKRPELLKAENLETRDQGFYRLDASGRLVNLITAARAFGPPIKAKDADVLVLTSATFYDYPDLMVTNSEFRELRKVTDANPQKSQFVWGKAELIRYKSADGAPLAGQLIKPENFDPNKKYPMIVYIYEKLSQGLHQFVNPAAGTSINASYYASKGYVVLKPDIVYKIGYPGQSALKCVLPAIQAVVDQGFIDENAIGIQGHSWGGYQIAYMVTQTNRFKAAAPGAPVSNMTSAYGGIRWDSGLPRQFQYERTQSRIGGSLWQFPMRFVENSPIFMADRVATPLLMLHNDQDGAVPWYQGIEYYLALRRLGKEVYMFNYNGEKHGLAKKVNQRDYTIRMEEFFDHHLRNAPMPAWMASGIPYRPQPGVTPKGPAALAPAPVAAGEEP